MSEADEYAYLLSQSVASLQDKDRFLSGSCHLLALAFHQELGWNLACVESHEEDYVASYEDGTVEEVPCVLHVYAVDEKNRAWDIMGSRDFKNIRDEMSEIHGVKNSALSINLEFSESSFRENYVSQGKRDLPLTEVNQEEIDEVRKHIKQWFPQINPELKKKLSFHP